MIAVARMLSVVAAAIGLLGLLGYVLASPILITVRPGFQGMSPLTATGIVALALAILGYSLRRERPARWGAGLAILLAGLALASHAVAGADAISPWLAEWAFRVRPDMAGRTSLGTALGLCLVGVAVLLRHRRSAVPDALAGIGLLLSGFAVLGYAYGVSDLYALPVFNSMAIHTALSIACLAMAVLSAEPEHGWASVIASDGMGGGATRRQLAIVLLPAVAGWLLLRWALAGSLGPGAAMAMLVAITVVPLALLILRDGRVLDALDAERSERLRVQDDLARTMQRRLEEQAAELTRESQERARAEAAMVQAQRMEAVGHLTGGIAHDFNNLLMAVRGNLELLERRMSDDERARRYLTNAIAATDKGAKVTGQLLAFSRSQRLAIRPIDLEATLRGARELIGSSLGPGIAIELDLQTPAIWVETDPDQLELAILNMAVNARDAMPDGGMLRIASSTTRERAPEEQGGAELVAIRIEDTGHGMPPEVLAKAAEPFFTTKERGKGTGLGLAQVYGFVRQCGGDLRLSSAPGAGTRIELMLRRAAAGAKEEASSGTFASPPAADQTGRSVLVIDDDDGVRAVIVDALRGAGFTVAEAADGAAGLALLETFAPAAAVIDFMMPGMNGAEVAKHAQVMRPGLPIVFVSGYSDTLALDGIAGAVVLRKPFDMAGLRRAMSSVMH